VRRPILFFRYSQCFRLRLFWNQGGLALSYGACPEGVDVLFDNTAGLIYNAVMKNLSIAARVVSGQFGSPDVGERFMSAPSHQTDRAPVHL
jgi:hypothetical protein